MSRKSTPGKVPNFGRLLAYVSKEKPDKPAPLLLCARNLVHTDDLKKMEEEFVRLYKDAGIARASKRVYQYHSVMSWAAEDREALVIDKLRVMAEAYLEMRHPDAQSAVFLHWDTECIHLHIVSSGLQLDYTANRVDKAAFRENINAMNVLQQKLYPELTSRTWVPERVKPERISNGEYWQRHTGRTMMKDVLKGLITDIAMWSDSRKEFFRLLESHGVKYHARGEKSASVSLDESSQKFRMSKLGFGTLLEELDEKEAKLDEIDTITESEAEKDSQYCR